MAWRHTQLTARSVLSLLFSSALTNLSDRYTCHPTAPRLDMFLRFALSLLPPEASQVSHTGEPLNNPCLTSDKMFIFSLNRFLCH